MSFENKAKGCLLGLAIGDALGAVAEFRQRGSYYIERYESGGTHNLKAGQYTDDTSLALCIAQSLIERKGFNAKDIMDKFVRWHEEGYMSSTGECFDIGRTTYLALDNYKLTGNPYSGSRDITASGNGGIMRLAPIPIFYYPNLEATLFFAQESSEITHASEKCLSSAKVLANILYNCFSGAQKVDTIEMKFNIATLDSEVRSMLSNFWEKKQSEIGSTGYVVSTLEAALWCFFHSDSFKEGLILAVNLGGDTDTIGAVYGQIAGAYYGLQGIDSYYIENLQDHEKIEQLVEELIQTSKKAKTKK